ncbi:MAG TPA: hypothetical protein PKA55_00525 [Rhodoblastus sp.]|nr:hypothetical protein [Rhodoblastus sp.]
MTLRISRARVIGDIERIVKWPGPLGQHVWSACGAACAIDRHSFGGVLYGFSADILHVRMPATGRIAWELIIVTEFWRRGDGEAVHSAKWLKMMSGKPTELLKWISSNRDAGEGGAAIPASRPGPG